MQTLAYGPNEHQVGDLYLPGSPQPPVICLLHGGFWRMPYQRGEMSAVARDLAQRGFAVWNLEYRRLGANGGGWPGTFEDVAAGIDHLAELATGGIALDLDRVVVAGHSAGGQLALWAARREAGRTPSTRRVRVAAAAGLAAVADLARAHALALNRDAVAELLDGSPTEQPERYRATSPIDMLPLGVPQLLLHGIADDVLPIEISRRYAQVATAAGDPVQLVELEGAGHMDFLDPASEAHAALCRWLDDTTRTATRA